MEKPSLKLLEVAREVAVFLEEVAVPADLGKRFDDAIADASNEMVRDEVRRMS